jgi:hypothetical protein
VVRFRQSLPQAVGEDDFAIGQVGQNLRGLPAVSVTAACASRSPRYFA